jgi:hypothetical protein
MASAAELEKLAEHVRYEVDELRKAVQKLSKLKKEDSEWNAAIESFLLHFRILRAFFFAEGNNGDDVLAKHYVAGWNPTKNSVFENTRVDINKRLAHLTAWRLNTFSHGWPVKDMWEAIEELVSEFKKSLPAPRSGWFSGLAERPVILVLGVGFENYSTCSTNSPSTITYLFPDS